MFHKNSIFSCVPRMMARGRKEDLIACAGTSEGMRSVGFGIYEMAIPESVTSIGRDSFTFCDDLTIFAPAGSYAEKYAKEENIRFRAV